MKCYFQYLHFISVIFCQQRHTLLIFFATTMKTEQIIIIQNSNNPTVQGLNPVGEKFHLMRWYDTYITYFILFIHPVTSGPYVRFKTHLKTSCSGLIEKALSRKGLN